MDLSGIPQFIAGGLAIGAVYGLVGAGFSLVFSATKIVNFAQGEFVVIGGLTAASLASFALPLWIALPATLLVAAVLGLGVYGTLRLARPGSTELSYIMVTLGIAISARGLAAVLWGTDFVSFQLYPSGGIRVLTAVVSISTLWLLVITAAVSLGLYLLLYRTTMGKAIRACGDNPIAAQTVGIEPRNVVALMYIGSALLGGLAGILTTPVLMMSYDNGVMLALKGFTAAVAGGLSNPFGAIAGGLLLGVIEGLCVGLISSDLQNAYGFIALLVLLVVMPQGLFGRRREAEVR